jgi:hypothetical protein
MSVAAFGYRESNALGFLDRVAKLFALTRALSSAFEGSLGQS